MRAARDAAQTPSTAMSEPHGRPGLSMVVPRGPKSWPARHTMEEIEPYEPDIEGEARPGTGAARPGGGDAHEIASLRRRAFIPSAGN